MKTFEEKWTAWIDGQLSGHEREEFEASLPDRAAAEAEKSQTLKLGAFLKEQLQPIAMGNEDFFQHQLRTRIESESDVESEREEETFALPALSTWWSIRRLLWAGAASLAIFVVCTFLVLNEKQPQDQSPYLSQILQARVDSTVSPYATVSIFQTKEDRVTVLWVDGLKSLPTEYAAR
jgi:anti-sigma factor RsiW